MENKIKKEREVVTKDNYKQIVLKRAIILCWVLLAICFIVKIFGGNFFNIVCENKKFISVCDYVDRHIWLQFIIGCISSYITYALFYLAICRKLWFAKSELIFLIVSIPIFVGLRILANLHLIGLLSLFVNIIQYFIIPFFIKRDKSLLCSRWFIPYMVIGNVLNLVFQFVSLIIKNLSIFKLLTDNFLIAIIFSIDVFIMLVLYYLYSILKGDKKWAGG